MGAGNVLEDDVLVWEVPCRFFQHIVCSGRLWQLQNIQDRDVAELKLYDLLR